MAFKLATLSVAAGIASGVVSALLLSWVSRPRDAEAHRVYVNGSAAIVRGNGSGSNTPPRLNPAEEERAHAEALRAVVKHLPPPNGGRPLCVTCAA